jgi:mRNA interferase RelE/StbE
MTFKIELSNKSVKYLNKLDKPMKKRISDHLLILRENPRHPELDIKKLKGSTSLYRLRVGNYRILYTIEDNILVVFVIKIGPRGDVYDDI